MKIMKESDTYDKREIVNYVLDLILDKDRYFNIQCAYDSDVSSNYSIKEVKSKLLDYVSDMIINELDGDPEFEDQVYDIVSEDSSVLDEINDYFKSYGDKQLEIWNDERDSQNREYFRMVGLR